MFKRLVAALFAFFLVVVACTADDSIDENSPRIEHPDHIVGQVSSNVKLGMASGVPTWKIVIPYDLDDFTKGRIINSLSDWSLSTNYLQWYISEEETVLADGYPIVSECDQNNQWTIRIYNAPEEKMPLTNGGQSAGYSWWFISETQHCSLVYLFEDLSYAEIDDMNRVVRHELGHAFGLLHLDDGKSVMSGNPISSAEWLQPGDIRQYCEFWKCPK